MLSSAEFQSDLQALLGGRLLVFQRPRGLGVSGCLDVLLCVIQAVICKYPLCVRPLRKPGSRGGFLHSSFEDGEKWTSFWCSWGHQLSRF